MKRFRWVISILKYAVGVLCWLIVFGLLRHYCIFDMSSVIDGLWVKELHGSLVENAIDEIAFHAGGGNCGADGEEYIYNALYYLDEYGNSEVRSLTSLVDVATWKEIEEDQEGESNVHSPYFYFIDSRHRYTLHYTSDEIFISAEER